MDVDQVIAGRYRLSERLGGGGMGVVWRAHDERLRRTVAVKEVILPPSLDEGRLEEIRRRTMREGRIAAKLHHPQLITVYDVIEDDGRPYIVMEYLPSTSLARLLDDRGSLPPEEVARIGSQSAAALASAHAGGVVHRDVKPGNILVGDSGTVKITDFGVSRVVEDVTGTVTGTFVGTPAYLAPEVAQGKDVTFASDVYSLGATLYKAVEGTSPVGSSDNPMALLHRIASGTTVAPKQAGPLTDILTRLLNADPAQRPTMLEAKAALDEISAGHRTAVAAAPVAPATPAGDEATERVPAPPPAAVGEPGNDPKRRRAVALLLAVCVLVAVTTTLVVLNNNDTGGDGGNAGAGAETSAVSEPESTTESQPAQSQPESRSESPSTPPPPSTPPSSRPDDAPQNPGRPPANPTAAVTGYYALMPGNPDQGWTRLTPRFQASPAGGLASYRSYWNSIRSVQASQASGKGATVQVTVSYVFKDGRRIRERHLYTLAKQNGGWLLDRVSVLSSTTAP